MKKITVTSCFRNLFVKIFLVSLTIGGVSFAQIYNELPIFELTIENSTSKISTVMFVFADSEETARSNVYLNGWVVKGIRKLTEKETVELNLSAEGLDDKFGAGYNINSLAGSPAIPKNDSTIGSDAPLGYPDVMGGNKPDSVREPSPMSTFAESEKVEDNLDLLPESPEIEYLLTLNFDLGVIEPILNPQLDYRLKSMAKDRKYIIFGHADDVPIGKEAPYKSNYALSYMRAEAVKKLMTDNGIGAENIKTVGLGIRYPLELKKGSSLANRRAGIYGFRTQK